MSKSDCQREVSTYGCFLHSTIADSLVYQIVEELMAMLEGKVYPQSDAIVKFFCAYYVHVGHVCFLRSFLCSLYICTHVKA